ncbi:MAG: HD domain-containing protein [Eubacterium sp.]|nr:HD domain-containing protein [Eubacterium sp.]
MKPKEQKICRDIRRHGQDILRSELFQKAGNETHHLRSSVSDHSLYVSITGVRICHFLKHFGIRMNEKDLIQASLCHDLGMVGREDKYKTRRTAWRAHADESARLAKTVVPDINDTVKSMISTHMWPASGKRPETKEGAILTIADKYASIADWAGVITKHRYKDKIKQEIL